MPELLKTRKSRVPASPTDARLTSLEARIAELSAKVCVLIEVMEDVRRNTDRLLLPAREVHKGSIPF